MGSLEADGVQYDFTQQLWDTFLLWTAALRNNVY